jgi:hypothetical protein
MVTPPLVKTVQAAQEKLSRETDLYGWLLNQANELRSRQPEFIDWDELAEELDEIVALARTEVVSRLRNVLAHLLKWKYQASRRDEDSWRNTIVRERLDLALLLESKNLRNYVKDTGYALAYQQARKAAGNEMKLERRIWDQLFPATSEWDYETALEDEFFPSPDPSSNGHSR